MIADPVQRVLDMTVPEDELLTVAHEAARAAARELMSRFGGDARGVRTKSTATDPVSDADLAAEAEIRRVLGERRPGDAILGDSDGVIVMPAHLADEIADEAFEMTAFEDFVTEQVRRRRSIFGLYPVTDEQTLVDFAAWRKANGR